MTSKEFIAVLSADLYADPNVDAYITMATQRTNAGFYGVNYTLAVALLACHMYILNSKRAGQSGVLTYEAAGRLMRSFSSFGVDPQDYQLTNYGLQLLTLRKQSGVGAMTTAENIYSTILIGS